MTSDPPAPPPHEPAPPARPPKTNAVTMTAAGVAILATLVLFSLWFTGALWLVAKLTDTEWIDGLSIVQISIAALVGIIGTWASWYLAIDSVSS